MDIRIFTLPFDPVLEGFPDDQIAEFCLNKRVHRLDAQFFVQEGRAYWSVAIHYDPLVGKQDNKRVELDEVQKLLYDRLREWRKEQAHKDGIPVCLIATNLQLLDMVRRKTREVRNIRPFCLLRRQLTDTKASSRRGSGCPGRSRTHIFDRIGVVEVRNVCRFNSELASALAFGSTGSLFELDAGVVVDITL